MVTASHNPIDYNGIKIVKARSRPLTESDFSSIKVAAEKGDFVQADRPGEKFEVKELARAYVKKLKEFLDLPSLKPLKIVINSGNGAAGPTLDALIKSLEEEGVHLQVKRVNHEPDHTFPNGIPNPLIKENQAETSDIVRRKMQILESLSMVILTDVSYLII